jgi:hypothetical protein
MSIRGVITDYVEKWLRFVYKWITDKDEVLGEIVYMLHMFGFWTLIVLIIISHTFYPVFWFQFMIFSFVCLVWIQHLILNTCVLTSIERKLLGPKNHLMIDSLLNVFNIPIQKETRMGVTLMLSTVGVLFLGLELSARTIVYGRSVIGASTWI